MRRAAAIIFSAGATAGLAAMLVVSCRSRDPRAAAAKAAQPRAALTPVRAPGTPVVAGVGSSGGSSYGAGDDVPVTMDTVGFLRDLDADDERAIDTFLERADAGERPGSNASVTNLNAQLLGLAAEHRPALRRGALAVLARVRPERLGADPFTPALADKDAEVRRQAVIGASRHHASKGWPLLVGLMKDTDERVRAAVATALSNVGSEAAERAVADMLNDSSDVVVTAAAEALGGARSAVAAAAVDRAAKSSSARLRRAAAVAYGVSRLAADVHKEVGLARDADECVRRAALRGLGGFVAMPVPEVRATLEAVACDATASRVERLEAIESLAFAPGVAGSQPLASVAERDDDLVVRLAAARTGLAQCDASAFAALVGILETQRTMRAAEDECKRVRAIAGETLREATERDPDPPTAAEWRRLLPTIGMQFVTRPIRYSPARLAEFR